MYPKALVCSHAVVVPLGRPAERPSQCQAALRSLGKLHFTKRHEHERCARWTTVSAIRGTNAVRQRGHPPAVHLVSLPFRGCETTASPPEADMPDSPSDVAEVNRHCPEIAPFGAEE